MKYLLASEIVDRITMHCECGAPAIHVCQCGKPICESHSYDAEGAHKYLGMCDDCAQIAIYESWAERNYGDADKWN